MDKSTDLPASVRAKRKKQSVLPSFIWMPPEGVARFMVRKTITGVFSNLSFT